MTFNDTPVDPIDPADSTGGGTAKRSSQSRHVYWLLLAALAAPSGAWTFSEDERASMAEHLAHCDDCRARVATLDSVLVATLLDPSAEAVETTDIATDSQQTPDVIDGLAALQSADDFDELDEHSAIGEIPTDQALTDYIITRVTRGQRAAARRYRAVAEHVAACGVCQETVDDLSNDLQAELARVPPLPEAPAQARRWRTLADGAKRLVSAFEINVRSQSITILHEVSKFLAAPEIVPAKAFRKPPDKSPVPAYRQSITLDLTDGDADAHEVNETSEAAEGATAERWVHLHVNLRAEFMRRLSGELRYTWRQHDGADSPAAGISWRIVRDTSMPGGALSDQERLLSPPVRKGLTNTRGISRFYLDESGAYALVSDVEGQRWTIPLSITVADGEAATHALIPIQPQEQTNQQTHGGKTAASLPLTVGQRLTDYTHVDMIVKHVASGGFGIVAMGPDRLRDDQWVTLKTLRWLLRPDTDPMRTQRLRNTFIQTSLQSYGVWPHPNLLGLDDLCEIDGQPFLVLDYAAQGSLRDLFTRTRQRGTWLTLAFALQIGQQIAAGLLALHTPDPDHMREHPIVHRDLKPENTLLDAAGFARISDIDLAAFWRQAAPEDDESDSQQAQPERIVGTPAYMAPEQWTDAAQVDTAADVYAFGVILYELLTSHHPLLDLEQSHSLDAWRQAHLTGQPIPLRQLGAEVFAAEEATQTISQAELDTTLDLLEYLIERPLAKNPSDRPTVQEALVVLQSASRALGQEQYSPPDIFPHTVENERIFWQRWANACMRFDRYGEALLLIQRALALTPQNPVVVSTWAGALAGVGRSDEAVAAYHQALVLSPPTDAQRRADILLQLGIILGQQERFSEAEEAYAETVALIPDYANAWYNRANNQRRWALTEHEAGQPEEARAHAEEGLAFAEQVVALNPNNPNYARLAQALRQLRDALRIDVEGRE